MIRVITYSILLFIMQISILRSQSLPDWIEQMPQDSEYYWARESVGMRGLSEQEYKEKANSRALTTISMQIRTTVSGQTTSNISEVITNDESIFTDDFNEETSTSTIADIQGAELFDDYKTSTTYWVIWRLNKTTHENNMAKYVNSALGQYEGYTFVPANDPIQQLQYLVPAYEDVIKVAGVPVNYEGINLKTAIPNLISKILNSIRLVADGESEFTGQAGFALAKPLKIRVIGSKGINISDIPILFNIESGEVNFSTSNIRTNSSGKGKTNITKIISQKSIQRVRATIDLREFREDRQNSLISFENRLDKISNENSVLFTLDIAQMTQEEIAVITVGDTSKYNEKDLKRLNRAFRSDFRDLTTFKLKDEALAEKAMEQYKRSSDLCSSEECQIQIGVKLGVEKLIFIDLAEYPKKTDVTIFLRNISENELEQEYTYSFDKSGRDNKEKKIQRIEKNTRLMVEDFWGRNNPGYVTLNSRERGTNVLFNHLDPTQWMEKSFEKRLPIRSAKFYQGTYEIDINKLGYEKYHDRFEVAMGDFPEIDIELNPKRRTKAFFRSLIIPGRGQFYMWDEENPGRLWAGITYLFSTMTCAGLSVSSWSTYFSSEDEYKTSKLEYQNAILVDDIVSKQLAMTQSYDDMIIKKDQAKIITGVTIGIWLFNAIDAVLFFPSEYKGLSWSIEPYGLAINSGLKTELTLGF